MDNKVTLAQVGTNPEVTQEFDLAWAQRILDVKHPQKTWVLASTETNFKVEQGKIVAI